MRNSRKIVDTKAKVTQLQEEINSLTAEAKTLLILLLIMQLSKPQLQ
jgi:hypothetical protein